MNKDITDCDEYPASQPELGTFWEDNDGWIYFCYDYDHFDHSVYLMGVENKYSIGTPKHNTHVYYEELFQFDNLYHPIIQEEEILDDYERTIIHDLSSEALVNLWDVLKLHEQEKRLILLGKAP
jgi:hypothetical protein